MTTTLARVTCDQPTARRLADFLGESLDPDACVCAAFEDERGQWQVEIHFREPPDQTAVRSLAALAAGEAVAAAIVFEPVAPADWVAKSLAGLTPVRAGRFIVHGAHDRARVRPNDIAIEIEAALAFGTGHHGTTRGCLLALDDLAKRRRRTRGGVTPQRTDPHPARGTRHPPPCRGRDKKVLDLGTGSGVLAIAAAKILRTRIVATDIDPRAVQSARGNARLNRSAPGITMLCATGTRSRAITAAAPYDLIFANILLGPLLRLAVPLRLLASAKARIVLSGLLPAHANAVLAAYRLQGLSLERRITLDGWVTLVMKRG